MKVTKYIFHLFCKLINLNHNNNYKILVKEEDEYGICFKVLSETVKLWQPNPNTFYADFNVRRTNSSLTKNSSSFSSGPTPPTRFKLNIKKREQTPYYASSAISSSTIETPMFSPVLPISLEEEEEEELRASAAEEQTKDDAIKSEVTKAAATKKSKNCKFKCCDQCKLLNNKLW